MHIISCRVHVRGKSNKLGSRGSEQGREVGCLLLINHLDSSRDKESREAPCKHVGGDSFHVENQVSSTP